MCYTALGLEVTRCSVVDASGSVVYDTLVLPSSPILDYNTAHSGISADMMTGVLARLADVQAHLLDIISEQTILVPLHCALYLSSSALCGSLTALRSCWARCLPRRLATR